jgi:glycosyltransferase involved in cell wall biosynthesis
MRISVVIPCHNAGAWVGAALRSVFAQAYRPLEIIVVDDDSTDDSIRQIEQSGGAVTLLRTRVRNAAAARNAGIEAAAGDWVALLDADDVWYPNHLARASALLGQSDDVAFMSNHDWISLEGRPTPMPADVVCKEAAPRSGLSVNDFWRIAEEGFHFGHSTVVYRRERAVQVGLFDVTQRRRHDIDLWLRVIAGRTWSYDTVKGAGYRVGVPDSLSKDDVECDYYYLRALVKNATSMVTPRFRAHLARHARRAMGIAFVDGPAEHFARIRTLAWPRLSPLYRLLYDVAGISPTVARRIIRTKRALRRVLFDRPPAAGPS